MAEESKGTEDSGELEYVKLVSAEGQEFFLEKNVAMISKTIEAMLLGGFAESSGQVKFQEISGQILEKVCQYLHYKAKYKNSTQPIPDFNIDPEIVAELLMAANFLDC